MSVVNQQILHQPAPSKNWTDTGPSSGRSQRLMRYTVTIFDQHKHATRRGGLFAQGRPWWGEKHIAANRDEMKLPGGRPIPDPMFGPLTPGEHVLNEQGLPDRIACLSSSWEAPYYPREKYFKFDYERNRITFDYPRMRLEEVTGLTAYWKAAGKLGAHIGFAVERGKPPHSQIIDVLGEPSEMATIAEALIAGDPWLVGHRDEPNEKLARILGFHPMSAILVESPNPVTVAAERAEQQERTDAINAAPPNMDLLEMIAGLIDRKFAERDRAADVKKAADKARMDRIRPKSKHKAKAKTAHENVQVTD